MTLPRFDHRPLVAARRREKMQARLVEAALLVFAENGLDNVVIEDVIAAAGVSRGSFYNHFSDVAQVMVAARDALVDELLDLSLTAVHLVADPARASALGLRVALEVTARYPLLSRFSAKTGLTLNRGNLCGLLLPPLLEEGMKAGRFAPMPVDLAADLVAAQVVVAFQRQAAGIAFDLAEVIAAILRLLGLPAAEAMELATTAGPRVTLPEGGLIARSEAARRARLPAAEPAIDQKVHPGDE